MNTFFRTHKFHFLIVFVGICLLQFLNFQLQLGKQTLIYPDCSNYLESAQKMYHKFTGHYYRPMVMAFITGLPYLFDSSDSVIFQWSFYLNVACWLGTSLLIFEILKDYLASKKASVVAVVPFTILGTIVVNFHLLTENIFIFTMMLSFYFLHKYHKTKQFLFLSLSLSILMTSMLIKPASKFLAILIVVYFIKVIYQNYKSKYMFFLYAALLMIIIQVVGMKAQYGDFTISYIDGVTYHNYICSKAECFKNGKEYQQINNPRAEYLFGLDFTLQKKVALEDLKKQVSTNSLNLWKAYVDDVKENSVSGNACVEDLINKDKTTNFEFWKSTVFWITKWQNRIFTLLSLLIATYFLAKSYRKPTWITFVSVYILYIIATSGISCGQGDRFHLAVFPFAIVLVGIFFSEKRKIKTT